MMGKSKELSVDLRNLIVEKHFDGNGYRRISRMLKMCVHVYVVYEDTNLYNDMGMT